MSTESPRETGLIYVEAPPVSKEFTAEFNRIVPICPNEKDRYLRYSWGCDRLEFIGGHWERRYGDINNDPPKYVGRPRWILEGWQSPDVYNRAEWEAGTRILGEWPANGVWDFIEYHEDADGEYLPLDNSALERVRNWKYWRSKGFARSIEHLMEQRELRRQLQQQRREAAAKVVSTRFGEQAVKLMENNTNPVSTSGRDIGAGYKQTESGILIKD